MQSIILPVRLILDYACKSSDSGSSKMHYLKDVTIEDPSMEEVIRLLYGKTSHV